jgi:hypothetical protein
MFWSFCSAKGGAGVSVLAASVALRSAAGGQRVLLVDLGGDQPDLLGVGVDAAAGVTDWLAADVGADALASLTVPVADGLDLLPLGAGDTAVGPQRVVQLGTATAAEWDLVVADVGVLQPGPFDPRQLLVTSGDRTTLVVRACFLGLSRAGRLSVPVDDVVEVAEGGRALRTVDIEGVLGQPVVARVAVDPAIARAVDAGLLTARLPRALRRAADTLQRPARARHAA